MITTVRQPTIKSFLFLTACVAVVLRTSQNPPEILRIDGPISYLGTVILVWLIPLVCALAIRRRWIPFVILGVAWYDTISTHMHLWPYSSPVSPDLYQLSLALTWPILIPVDWLLSKNNLWVIPLSLIYPLFGLVFSWTCREKPAKKTEVEAESTCQARGA